MWRFVGNVNFWRFDFRTVFFNDWMFRSNLQFLKFTGVVGIEGDDAVLEFVGEHARARAACQVAVGGTEADAVLLVCEEGTALRLFALRVLLAFGQVTGMKTTFDPASQ